MPDITMCSTTTCPIRRECYRFTAEPEKYWQSYSDFYEPDSLNCNWFINIFQREQETVTQKVLL